VPAELRGILLVYTKKKKLLGGGYWRRRSAQGDGHALALRDAEADASDSSDELLDLHGAQLETLTKGAHGRAPCLRLTLAAAADTPLLLSADSEADLATWERFLRAPYLRLAPDALTKAAAAAASAGRAALATAAKSGTTVPPEVCCCAWTAATVLTAVYSCTKWPCSMSALA